MTKAASISLSAFTTTVQRAVKAAVQKHQLHLPEPQGITVSYLVRGIPVPDALLAKHNLTKLQAFADDVANEIATAHPPAASAALGPKHAGAIISARGHVTIGIVAAPEVVLFEK